MKGLDLLIALVVAIGIFIFIALTIMVSGWLERKVAGHIQSRVGPMRVGKHGWAQLIADTLKMLFKEDIVPKKADKLAFVGATFVVFVPVFLAYLVIPFSSSLIPRDLNVGLLYFLAVPSISVLGIIMAGWSSRGKYALLGGMRSAAQMISYEIPRALSVIGVVMLTGTLSTNLIVSEQHKWWFILLQPLGFLIFYITSLAEAGRIPFDLPVAESELVSGYFTEYSGIRFALFQMAEYAHLLAACLMAAVLFLGGWRGPFLPPVLWLLIKGYILIFVAMWLRWTLPRFRIDQLMNLCWKVLIPLALINIGFTGILMLLAMPKGG